MPASTASRMSGLMSRAMIRFQNERLWKITAVAREFVKRTRLTASVPRTQSDGFAAPPPVLGRKNRTTCRGTARLKISDLHNPS